MHNERITEIKNLVESILNESDFFLVDIEIKGSREPVVWVYVDGPERGVNMDECAEISNELGLLMDAHNLFQGQYRLNVSSPGLSRPLTDKRQYFKNKGRKAKVKYKSGDEYLKTEGTIADITEEIILIKKEDDTSVPIGFNQIVETKIIPVIK